MIWVEVLELWADSLQIHQSKWINEQHAQRLARSIADEGILAPLLVVKEQLGYTVVSGAHRLEAAKQLGIKTVPCIQLSSEEPIETLVLQLDSIQRQNNPMQEGQLLKTMLNLGYTQEQIARMVGRSASWVQHRIALVTTLADALQKEVVEGTLSSKKAQDIARLALLEQEKFAAKVKLEKLSAKQVAKLVALYNRPNTDEQMKQCIINTPSIALTVCSKRRSTRKEVSPTVRGLCNTLDELLQQLEDFQTTLSEEGLSSVEQRELQSRIAQATALLGQFQSVISGERTESVGQVCLDSENSRWPDVGGRSVPGRKGVSVNSISVPKEIQDGTSGRSETQNQVRCRPEQGLKRGADPSTCECQDGELQAQCGHTKGNPQTKEHGDKGPSIHDSPCAQATQCWSGKTSKEPESASADGLQGPYGGMDGRLFSSNLPALPNHGREDATNAPLPMV